MERGAQQAMVHMVVKSQTWLKQLSRQAVQTCVVQGSIVFLLTCILLFLILWKTLANAAVFLGTQKTWGLICRYPRPAPALSFLCPSPFLYCSLLSNTLPCELQPPWPPCCILKETTGLHLDSRSCAVVWQPPTDMKLGAPLSCFLFL